MNTSRPIVVCIGSFPPPIHGVSVSLSRIANDLEKTCVVKRLSISPGNRSGLNYHLTRVARVLVSIMRMAAFRLGGSKSLYTPADAGLGALYSCVIVGIGRLLGYRVVVHHHSFAYLLESSIAMNWLVRLGGQTTLHVLLCECMRNKFQQLYPTAEQAQVVSNSAHGDCAPPGNASLSSGDTFRIGFLCNLTYEKGFSNVVSTFEKLVEAEANIQLILAGPTSDPRIEQEIHRLRSTYGNRIDYLGLVQEKEKADFFEAIDVFLFPTQYQNEAQPYVLIEAISAGVPCIALRRGCISETLSCKENLVIDSPEDFDRQACRLIFDWIDNPSRLQAASLAVADSAQQQQRAAEDSYQRLLQRIAFGDSQAGIHNPNSHNDMRLPQCN